jgi:hypothetical protein
MKIIIQNIVAVVLGVMAGGLVNMGIIFLSGSIIPPPEGADLTSAEGLKAAIPLFKPINFLMPFLAHALGTLIGAILTAKLAVTRKNVLPYIVGLVFLAGGTDNVFMLPAPLWFDTIDLLFAYIPMAFLAIKSTIK